MREDSLIDLSVVVPLFNEEETVRLLYKILKEELQRLGLTYEIIFVDDGSRDRTFEILTGLQKEDTTLKVIKFRRNYGQTPAMTAGFDFSSGRVIITMDGDLQNDPKDIPKLLEKIEEGYDIVSGWRKHRKDKAITRKIPSKIANWLIGVITGVKIHDYGCTLKAYRASIIKEMHLYSDMHRFIPALGILTGARITEVLVGHHPRMYGKSKYGISRTGKVMLDLITVKLITQFSSKPLHIFGALGAFILFLGTLFGIEAVNLYLFRAHAQYFPIVIPSVCLLLYFLGLYLVGIGILSELVLKMGDFRNAGMKTIIQSEEV